jgi:hypothetical protein
MATPTEYIKLTGTRLRETEKAVHFQVDQVGDAVLEESVTHWFPLSRSRNLPLVQLKAKMNCLWRIGFAVRRS